MEFCTLRQEGAILIVTMNHPEKLNALIPESHEQMAAIFRGFQADPVLRVAILTGAGRAFCAGSDISAYVAGTQRPLPPEGGAGLTHNRALTKPVIAAVNGLAMGGGFEIALACDIIVADEGASFALPEPKVGAAALGGGLVQLARKLPPSIAMQLALTGDRLPAARAWELGLVSELAPAGEVLRVAQDVAGRILQGAPLALGATRQIVRMAQEGEPQAAIDQVERELRTAVMGSTDFAEGMAAFMERRPPVWTGR
ncbi:enoyl-CoA hydratase-related protein [Sandaracinobacter sp. RS1-74]|uniref:enoyl-CoA hydratase-related protein n=1 Tax=Sandaracinobacteroides sayramensis TaxID=2913411 RepID=UPI001EDA0BA5|nr:enoyl-CoA hydratase-related protein [Sandaracinobacteroides sayramensis]MCG2840933.1 enoyl-CoA hydratase-related protein [Sandaracinobacteroides sayramensis]